MSHRRNIAVTLVVLSTLELKPMVQDYFCCVTDHHSYLIITTLVTTFQSSGNLLVTITNLDWITMFTTLTQMLLTNGWWPTSR